MVKNELSIRASQTLRIASKVADNAINKIKTKTNKEILAINSKIPFKSIKQENKLFEIRKQCLQDNLDVLMNLSNKEEVHANILKNNVVIQKINWSFVNIDRNGLSREKIRQKIATNRHQTVIFENKYEKARLEDKIVKDRFNKKVEFNLEYARLADSLYNDNYPSYERNSYNNFYEETCLNYQELKKEVQEKMETLLPLINQTIEKANEFYFAYDLKNNILSLSSEIVSSYKIVESLLIENINYDVDLQILRQQAKEKLDVVDEKREIELKIENNKKVIESEKSKQQQLLQTLDDNYKLHDKQQALDLDYSLALEDERQNKLLSDIKESFKYPSNQIFNIIFHLIEDYVISICPFWFDYLDNQEAKYQEDNNNYRQEVKDKLIDAYQKAFLSSKDDYLKLIGSKSGDNNSIEDIKKIHEENLAKINEQYIQDVAKIKQDRLNRKQEYLNQKASSKIKLKQADGNKATEIRELLKLYKKEINSGMAHYYQEASHKKKNSIKNENDRYQNEVIKETCPEAVSYKYSYIKQQELDNERYAKERKALNKRLVKDYNTSKYRRNLNTTTRENALGYLFLSVWAIGFLIFTLAPIIYTAIMSFSNIVYDNAGYSKAISFSFTKGITFPSWTGKNNFEALFLSDVNFAYLYLPRFFRSLLFFVPIVVFISFVLAMLLNSKIRGRTIFRIIYFLPVVIVSGPVLTMLNGANTSGQSSIRLTLDGSAVAKVLTSLSPKALQYANEVFQNFIIILWMTGVPIVLFISALQKINRQLYEAADIDGANGWQKLWTITFPLIKSVLLIVCMFTIMQVTTINVSFVNPINSWLENTMKSSRANLGVVALGSWCQTIVVLLFVLVSFLLFREKEFISKDKNYEEIEEEKRKKAKRKAKIREILHLNDIQTFFAKLFAPITNLKEARKAKKKEKEEMGG